MLPLAHGDIGSADEVFAGFLAFVLLLVVIAMTIRDSWRNRKRSHPPLAEHADDSAQVD